MNKQIKTRKRITLVLTLCLVLSLAVGSLAVFTDRFQAQTKVTAGTLDISLTESWTDDNAALAKVYKPSTALKLSYSLANSGNMAADIRETFVVSTDKQLTEADREFDLYAAADIKVDKDGNVTEITGNPLTLTAGTAYEKDGKTYYPYTYTPAQFTLNGADKTANPEATVNGGVDSYAPTYYLVFNTDVDNSFQNVAVGVEYMAQALQHDNTGDKTWTDAKVITESITIGGQTISVVPELK